jgi:hypothetical protein
MLVFVLFTKILVCIPVFTHPSCETVLAQACACPWVLVQKCCHCPSRMVIDHCRIRSPALTSLMSIICFPISLTPYPMWPWIMFNHMLMVMVTDNGFLKLVPHEHSFMRQLKRSLQHHWLPLWPLNHFRVLWGIPFHFLIRLQRQFTTLQLMLICCHFMVICSLRVQIFPSTMDNAMGYQARMGPER